MEPEGSLLHSPVRILSQLDLIHIPTSHFLNIHLNIIFPSTPGSPKWSLCLRSPHQNSVYASPLPHMRNRPSPSHYSRFYHPNYNHNSGKFQGLFLENSVSLLHFISIDPFFATTTKREHLQRIIRRPLGALSPFQELGINLIYDVSVYFQVFQCVFPIWENIFFLEGGTFRYVGFRHILPNSTNVQDAKDYFMVLSLSLL